MAFQIKRKSPAGVDLVTEEKLEDAVRAARKLMLEGVAKARITVTNLKTGETMKEADIDDAALSIAPPKQRSLVA